MPPYTQRPRCSMKPPNRRGSGERIVKSRSSRTWLLRIALVSWPDGKCSAAAQDLHAAFLRGGRRLFGGLAGVDDVGDLLADHVLQPELAAGFMRQRAAEIG